MDVPYPVDSEEVLCFRVSFEAGDYADEVTHLQFMLDDSSEPTHWLDAKVPDNWGYPRDTIGLPAPGPGSTMTMYIWVKDDYCEYGSTRQAHIMVQGQ
jgi:hypothetical protein